jgi:hypothetical protein
VDSTGDARIDSVEDVTDSAKDRIENTFEKTDWPKQLLIRQNNHEIFLCDSGNDAFNRMC